jgi:acyl-CoA thioesterase I
LSRSAHAFGSTRAEVEGLPFETFVIPDGLHLNDWGYAFMAKSLVALAEATSRPRNQVAVPSRRR